MGLERVPQGSTLANHPGRSRTESSGCVFGTRCHHPFPSRVPHSEHQIVETQDPPAPRSPVWRLGPVPQAMAGAKPGSYRQLVRMDSWGMQVGHDGDLALSKVPTMGDVPPAWNWFGRDLAASAAICRVPWVCCPPRPTCKPTTSPSCLDPEPNKRITLAWCVACAVIPRDCPGW